MCFEAKMQRKNKSAQSPRKTAPNRKRSDPLLLRVENTHILVNKVFDWTNGLAHTISIPNFEKLMYYIEKAPS